MEKGSTVHGLASGKGPDPAIWVSRLASAVKRLETYVGTQLLIYDAPGRYGEYSKKLIQNVLQQVRGSSYLEELLSPPKPVTQEWIVEVSGSTARVNTFLGHISALIVQSGQTPRDLFGFVDSLYARFSVNPIPYLLAIPFVRGTPFTQDFMELAIQPNAGIFPEARTYIRGKQLYVIYISPEIAQVPSNWPLLIHETAHIVEGVEFKAHEEYYSLDGMGDTASEEANWALEIACDAIATLTCGPVFGNRLLQNYLSIETKRSETHPPTKMRLEIVAEQLRKLGWSREAEEIERRVKEVHLPQPLEKAPRPEHISKILGALENRIAERSLLYKFSRDRKTTIDKISERLRLFKPCVVVDGASVELMDLLNASHEVDVQLSGLENYTSFQDFLGDMIRLSLVAQLSTKA